VAPPVDTRSGDRRLFAVVAWLFPVIMVIGFARSYYFRGLLGGPPVPSRLVEVHGIVMTAWMALFAAQIWLIRTRRVAVHRSLGMLGVALGVVILVVGFFTGVASAKFGSNAIPPNVSPLAFLVVPIFDLLMFAGLFGAAIVYRRQPAHHKRLMLLTVINFLPPSLGRMPVPALQALGPALFFGVPALLAIGLLVADRRRTGQMDRPFLIGAIALLASYPVRLALSETDVWLRFAAWLTTWAA
jgi:hypothetical protein